MSWMGDWSSMAAGFETACAAGGGLAESKVLRAKVCAGLAAYRGVEQKDLESAGDDCECRRCDRIILGCIEAASVIRERAVLGMNVAMPVKLYDVRWRKTRKANWLERRDCNAEFDDRIRGQQHQIRETGIIGTMNT